MIKKSNYKKYLIKKENNDNNFIKSKLVNPECLNKGNSFFSSILKKKIEL